MRGSGAVGWQPTGLMVGFWKAFRLQVGNVQVSALCVHGFWGCRLATYRFHGRFLDGVWACRLGMYRSYCPVLRGLGL